MRFIECSVRHGATAGEARGVLELVVKHVYLQFSGLIQGIVWSPDRTAVTITGVGYELEVRVGPDRVYVSGDVPAWGEVLVRPLVEAIGRAVRG